MLRHVVMMYSRAPGQKAASSTQRVVGRRRKRTPRDIAHGFSSERARSRHTVGGHLQEGPSGEWEIGAVCCCGWCVVGLCCVVVPPPPSRVPRGPPLSAKHAPPPSETRPRECARMRRGRRRPKPPRGGSQRLNYRGRNVGGRSYLILQGVNAWGGAPSLDGRASPTVRANRASGRRRCER